jgi:hypothetical protein
VDDDAADLEQVRPTAAANASAAAMPVSGGRIRPSAPMTSRAVGKSLIPPAPALAGWAIEHVPQIEAGRTAYESR